VIAPENVVTFDRAEGFRVLQSLGAAHGSAVCPRNVVRSTLRALGAFIGVAAFDRLTDAERARTDCLNDLMAAAERLGANGIIGVEFTASELPDGSTKVSAKGTAVILAPDSAPA
jgi:uncharacterized protein YbjQ (UPF0145 family)